jgi:hypothetical protein
MQVVLVHWKSCARDLVRGPEDRPAGPRYLPCLENSRALLTCRGYLHDLLLTQLPTHLVSPAAAQGVSGVALGPGLRGVAGGGILPGDCGTQVGGGEGKQDHGADQRGER